MDATQLAIMTAMPNDTFFDDMLKAAPVTISALAQGKAWTTLQTLDKLNTNGRVRQLSMSVLEEAQTQASLRLCQWESHSALQ